MIFSVQVLIVKGLECFQQGRLRTWRPSKGPKEESPLKQFRRGIDLLAKSNIFQPIRF